MRWNCPSDVGQHLHKGRQTGLFNGTYAAGFSLVPTEGKRHRSTYGFIPVFYFLSRPAVKLY
jgi:hypothetical protein